MKAFTQLALTAITSLRFSWSKQNPAGALAELTRIRDAAQEGINEISLAERDRQPMDLEVEQRR